MMQPLVRITFLPTSADTGKEENVHVEYYIQMFVLLFLPFYRPILTFGLDDVVVPNFQGLRYYG